MLLAILLGQQPAKGLRVETRDLRTWNSFDGEGRAPRREVRIDGPTAILALRLQKKFQPALRHDVLRLSAARETQRDEAGQRRRFEESAIGRLDPRQHAQSFLAGCISKNAGNRIARRRVNMAGLPDGNQRGQRITHDGQPQRRK